MLGKNLHFFLCDYDVVTLCFHFIVARLTDSLIGDVVLVKLDVFEK